jgi:(heptosyl)LPS beta-1,4-glucosyltransferase
MPSLSIIILTKNEEAFIDRCVRSVAWADEVLVLDSGSTDRTREIAQSLGATVYEQEWLGYSGQRAQAISLAQHDWIFFLDCDEIVTPTLAHSIQQVMAGSPNPQDGYSVDRQGDFLGVLLPNSSPRHRKLNFVRLFNRNHSGYDTSILVHEEVSVPGKIVLLEGVLIHWRAYIMDEYITSANRYATLEAKMLDRRNVRSSVWQLVLRPTLRFLWCYVRHGEIRLGKRGLIHSLLMATSEYIRYAKLWELQNAERVLHPPSNIYSSSAESSESVSSLCTPTGGHP